MKTLRKLANAISANETLMLLLPSPPEPKRSKRLELARQAESDHRTPPTEPKFNKHQSMPNIPHLTPSIDDIFSDVPEEHGVRTLDGDHERQFSDLKELSHFFDELKRMSEGSNTQDNASFGGVKESTR